MGQLSAGAPASRSSSPESSTASPSWILHQADGGDPQGAKPGNGEAGDRRSGGLGLRVVAGAEHRLLVGRAGDGQGEAAIAGDRHRHGEDLVEEGQRQAAGQPRGGHRVLLDAQQQRLQAEREAEQGPGAVALRHGPRPAHLPGADEGAGEAASADRRVEHLDALGEDARQVEAVGEVELDAVEQDPAEALDGGVGREVLAAEGEPRAARLDHQAGVADHERRHRERAVQFEADAAGAVEHHRPGLERDRERQRVAVGVELRLPRARPAADRHQQRRGDPQLGAEVDHPHGERPGPVHLDSQLGAVSPGQEREGHHVDAGQRQGDVAEDRHAVDAGADAVAASGLLVDHGELAEVRPGEQVLGPLRQVAVQGDPGADGHRGRLTGSSPARGRGRVLLEIPGEQVVVVEFGERLLRVVGAARVPLLDALEEVVDRRVGIAAGVGPPARPRRRLADHVLEGVDQQPGDQPPELGERVRRVGARQAPVVEKGLRLLAAGLLVIGAAVQRRQAGQVGEVLPQRAGENPFDIAAATAR